MAVAPQAGNDTGLLQRIQLGKNVGPLHRPPQGGGVHALQVRAQQHPPAAQPHLTANAAGDGVVVARKHLDAHAVPFQRGHGSGGRFFGRVQEGQKAQQRHIPLIVHDIGAGRGVHGPDGHGHHAQAVSVVAVHMRRNVLAQLRGQGHIHAIVPRCRADAQHLFQRALGDDLPLAVPALHHHAHASTAEIKGHFIHQPVPLPQILHAFFIGVADHGRIQQIFEARLQPAVQKSVAQYIVVVLAVDITGIFQNNPVLGQRAGLVRTEHVHGSQVLDGVEPTDNDPLASHKHGPAHQIGRNHRGQHLRRQPYGHGKGEDGGLHPIPFGQAINKKDHRGHAGHEPQQQPGNGVNPFVKAGGRGRDGKLPRQRAEQRGPAHGQHHPVRRAAQHVAAKKNKIVAVQGALARGLSRQSAGKLFHRRAFARQRGLAHKKILGPDHTHVRRDHVARGQPHHIAHYQVSYGQFPLPAVAQHGDGGLDHALQPGQGVARSRLLHKMQRAAHQHHARHDEHGSEVFVPGGGQKIVRDKGHAGQHQQNHAEGINKGTAQAPGQAVPVFHGQDIGPVALAQGGNLCRAKACSSRTQTLQHRIRRGGCGGGKPRRSLTGLTGRGGGNRATAHTRQAGQN